MQPYLTLLKDVLENGSLRPSRAVLQSTGKTVDTISVFGRQARFDLRHRFPAITTKFLWFKGVVHELLWILSGSTNIEYLKKNDVRIWDQWADKDGELGPVYGKQWRDWGGTAEVVADCQFGSAVTKKGVDQLAQVIEEIKKNPTSRRLIVNAWNAAQIPDMALPPCHMSFQFYVQGQEISCHMHMRSADIFLGVPFNIASYALLTCLIAQVTGLQPRELIVSFGDLHIYTNHIDQVYTQLSRTPYPAPKLSLNTSINSIDHFSFEDICLENYQSHPHIRAEVAV